MTKERLEAIKAEIKDHPEVFQREGYKYFEEFLPLIQLAFDAVPETHMLVMEPKFVPMFEHNPRVTAKKPEYVSIPQPKKHSPVKSKIKRKK